MADIIDDEEIDKDTVQQEVLEEQFNKKYHLLTEEAVTLKKLYINNLHGTNSLNLAVSLSDDSIKVYQVNNQSLKQVCHLSGHSKPINEVVFSPKEDHLLYSAGEDKVLKLWDTRTSGTCVQDYTMDVDNYERPFGSMDVSCDGRVLCAGSQHVQQSADLVFWDNRKPLPLGGYWESHNDDITQVKFHKEKSEILATGSEDGLMNIYNILEQTEEDALIYSMNSLNSVEKISWLNEKHIACVTQSNILQIWDTESADMIKSFSRDKIARAIKRSRGDDCYLIDTYVTKNCTPVLLAGSYGGKGDTLRSVSVADKKLQPATNFVQNKQIVKCCWYHKERGLLVTAGECGIISIWREGEGSTDSVTVAKKITNKSHVERHKPY